MNDPDTPSKRSDIEPFIVMDVLKAANERHLAMGDVLHLELGEPGLGAPASVLEAARDALEQQPMSYTEALGIPSLRERISRHYEETYNVIVNPERIVITEGSSAGFILAFLASFDAGARIAIAEPGYPAYRNTAKALDLVPVPVRSGRDEGFVFTATALSHVSDLAGALIASPANPTGTMVPKSELEAISAYCQTRGITLISDEIYHGITYGTPAQTILAFAPDAIVINSFSKYFCMTGWRLGWMVLPEHLMRPVERLAQNLFISPHTLSQHAAEVAFDCKEELDARVQAYGQNRAQIISLLDEKGLTAHASPDGAFYVYVDVSGLTKDSAAFCRSILADTGVALTPGTDFDHANGHRFVRISYAAASEEIEEAVTRLKDWLP